MFCFQLINASAFLNRYALILFWAEVVISLTAFQNNFKGVRKFPFALIILVTFWPRMFTIQNLAFWYFNRFGFHETEKNVVNCKH